jgi:hypothetical protein
MGPFCIRCNHNHLRPLTWRPPTAGRAATALLVGTLLVGCAGQDTRDEGSDEVPGVSPVGTAPPRTTDREIPGVSAAPTTPPPRTTDEEIPGVSAAPTTPPPRTTDEEIPGVSPQPTEPRHCSSSGFSTASDALNRALQLEEEALSSAAQDDSAAKIQFLHELPTDTDSALLALSDYDWISSTARETYQDAIALNSCQHDYSE